MKNTKDPEISKEESRLRSLMRSLDKWQNGVDLAPSRILRIPNEIELIKDKIRKIEKQMPHGAVTSFVSLFTGEGRELKSKKVALENELRSLEHEETSLKHQIEHCAYLERCIDYARKHIKTLEEIDEKRKQKNEIVLSLRAAAAMSASESRKIASSVKRRLKRQDLCPYCGKALGAKPHADHIYPLSKGGRSVPSNMVYICFDCNIKKRDLTLSGYIKKYALDRSAIEERLQELGKEF